MRTTLPRLLIAGLFLLRGLTCLSQIIVDPYASNSAPLTGARVAAVNYRPDLQVHSFRILGGDYWTDSSGRMIPWPASTPRNLGDQHHRFTRVMLGQASVTLPMSPAMVGILVMLILAGGLVLAGYYFSSRTHPADVQNPASAPEALF